MGSGPPKPPLSTWSRMGSASAANAPRTARTPTESLKKAVRSTFGHRARRRGGNQEATWGLLKSLHGTPRWAAVPPPPTHQITTPAPFGTSDAGV